MRINGLELPAAFIRDVQAHRFNTLPWDLRANENAWGEFMETELDEVFEDANRMQKTTEEIKGEFAFLNPDDVQYTENFPLQPGEVPYFWDFSKIVCFAEAADDAPFCFDFREDEAQPAVIWWADANWQRVAPSYEEFIKLFDIP